MTPWFIGIDPGAKGAVAVIHPRGHLVTYALDRQDESCRDVNIYLRSLDGKVYAAIEDLHAIFGAGASSTFAFGWACGYWHGVLDSLHIPITLVKPMTWQAEITKPPLKQYIPRSLPKKEAAKMRSDHKKALKAESMRTANELFPGNNITHDGVADAVCIAAWRRYRYLLENPSQ